VLSVAHVSPFSSAVGQSALFGLLSSMFLCKPTVETVINWRNAMSDILPEHAGDLQEAVQRIDLSSSQEMQDLLWDYTRLLVGPYRLPCPPWESVYTSSKRLVLQEASDTVRATYDELGLELGASNVFPDHVGVELNFMGILLEKIETSAGEEETYRNHANDFLGTHLKNWIPRFAADMGRAAETPLYKALARSTIAAVDRLGEALGV
jgi:TorA maturation chaperone TorD